jgi:Protein of unknown function (DUF2971)
MEDRKENKIFLYRIMPVHRVKELFEEEELVFLKPEAWKDPFENYLSKVSFIDSYGITHHIDYLNKVYGQCYSLGTETSLMWDAYTPNKDGVRIKIEKDKLINYLKSQKQYKASNFKSDKVTYIRYGDLITKMKNDKELIKLYKNQNSKLLDFFFEKRYEYRDEREFRIMYNANNDKEHYGKLFKIKIPVLDLVDSVRFDPKMPEIECEELIKYFKKKGMDGRKIRRSLLYKYEVKKKVKI